MASALLRLAAKGFLGRGGFMAMRTPKRRPNASRRLFVPRLAEFEDRTLPSTFTVTNLSDSGAGSLRAAIAAANANPGADSIAFANSAHGTIKLTSGELLITDSVTINGPGANKLSVSGNNASRVFEVAAGQNVTINDLTITRGHALDQGGGIFNHGSNLTLSGDDLTQNVVYEGTADTNSAFGGAIDSLSGSLKITACTLADNQALGGAGAAASGLGQGGGISMGGGSLTITDSIIQGNIARAGANSELAYAADGGIDAFSAASGVTISNCIFSDNIAIAGNVATDDYTASAAAAGGALGLGGTATISGTTFSGNEAEGGNGGTFGFVGEAEGGAISDFGPNGAGAPGTVSITNSTFSANQAIGGSNGNSGPGNSDPGVDESYGAGIFNFGGTINVSATTFSHNTSIGGNHATATGTDIVEVGVAEGGAICSEIGAATTFSDCTFDHNQAIGGDGNSGSGPVVHAGTGFGAGIFSGFGGVDSYVGATSLTVSSSTFTHNQAAGGDNNAGTASVAGLVGAGTGGGIMNALGGTASVTGSEFDNNQASGGRHNTAGGAGAAFAGLGAGGGIFNYLGSYDSSGYGPFDASVVDVGTCLFINNAAQGGNGAGGGIANLLSATTTVTGAILTLNHASGASGGSGLGGGAYNDADSSLTLSECLVTLNQATGSPGIGGGVYNLGTFTFDALTFIVFNHASTSGDNIGP